MLQLESWSWWAISTADSDYGILVQVEDSFRARYTYHIFGDALDIVY